jgi:nucleoside-diphosphate-sugar epimerase
VVHVEDVARILLAAPAGPGISVANVAAETVTVGDLARLARGERPADEPDWTVSSPFAYRHSVSDYLAGTA